MKTIIISTYEDKIGFVVEIDHAYESHDALLKAINRSVEEWVKTEEGRQGFSDVDGSFCWGDWINENIPVSGIRETKELAGNFVLVDNDEVFSDARWVWEESNELYQS